MEETLLCIWVHMVYMICIILNNNGFAYQTSGETSFHNVLFSFRNESATQETALCRVYCYISCVSMLKRFSCMVTILLCSGSVGRNRYYYILFVRLSKIGWDLQFVLCQNEGGKFVLQDKGTVFLNREGWWCCETTTEMFDGRIFTVNDVKKLFQHCNCVVIRVQVSE